MKRRNWIVAGAAAMAGGALVLDRTTANGLRPLEQQLRALRDRGVLVVGSGKLRFFNDRFQSGSISMRSAVWE